MNALGGADDEVNRRKQASEEVVKVTDKDQAKPKRPRYIWTRDVHNCFLDAVKQLGFKTAVPTKILELMNVEGLTRENVASHLQKYRLQLKRRDQERAQARTASENVPKAVYPHMRGIPQKPWVLPNTMQGINMDCACLNGSELAPSFANQNLNMIQAFPTIQEVYGTPFKDLSDEGVNRMSSVRLVHGPYDSNGPHDINKIGYNYGPLPPKPLVDSYTHNLMDRHDTTLVPQHDRADDQRNELFVADQGINIEGLGVGLPCLPEAIGDLIGIKGEGIEVGMPRPPTGVLGMKVEGLGLGMPRLPEATGIEVKGHGVGMPRLPEAIGGLVEMIVSRLPEATGGLSGIKDKGHGLGLPRLPEATRGIAGMNVPRLPEATGGLSGIKVKGHGQGVPRLPEATGGLSGIKFKGHGLGVSRLPEATGGLAEMKVKGHVSRLPEATGGLAGMKVEGHGAGATHLPEATGGLVGMNMPRLPEGTGGVVGMKFERLGADVTHLPGGPRLGMPHLTEASGGLPEMNDLQKGFSFELESDLDFSDSWVDMKGDIDGKSFDDDLFWR